MRSMKTDFNDFALDVMPIGRLAWLSRSRFPRVDHLQPRTGKVSGVAGDQPQIMVQGRDSQQNARAEPVAQVMLQPDAQFFAALDVGKCSQRIFEFRPASGRLKTGLRPAYW